MDEWFFEALENDGSICDSCGKSCDDCELYTLDYICTVTLCKKCISIFYANAFRAKGNKSSDIIYLNNHMNMNNKEGT